MRDALLALGYDTWILNALLVFPLAAALLLLAAPAGRIRQWAFVATLIEFVLSIGLWWTFDPGMSAMQHEFRVAWIPAFGISYHVGLDGISLFMVLLTTFTMPLAVLGSWKYITTRERGFYALMLVLTTGMLGVFVALDLFLFYVFWEVMLIPMYFIIGVWGGGRRLYAAIKFFVYTFVGSLLMLVAILVMVTQVGRTTGTYAFDYDHLLANAGAVRHIAFWLFAAFALAFAIKVPVFPFHTWLPDAHVEAPTPGSVVLAGILLKMGTYGFLRFAVPFFPQVAFDPTVSAVMVALAVIGVIYGALVAMVQPDFKKLIAYSSVSHLGFVMLGIWAVTQQSVAGAVIIMINHGVSTGALFLMAGMLYERRHSREIAAFGGLARVMPAFSAALTLVSLSSIGLPGTNGFVGEFLVLLGAFRTHPWAAGIATTGVIFAAAYLLWALQRIIYQKIVHPENETLPDLSRRELVVLTPLMVMILWIGLYPRPFLTRIERSVEVFVEQAGAVGPVQAVEAVEAE
ncbi:MAG TPA: NADH-quinone oxidoreductase subunit M [Gemmatimonadales bacterium]|nr:NADH-quinone oxidoreductase subunit M [Gemmatimonadales bacterium]